jgi:hypothetical protein
MDLRIRTRIHTEMSLRGHHRGTVYEPDPPLGEGGAKEHQKEKKGLRYFQRDRRVAVVGGGGRGVLGAKSALSAGEGAECRELMSHVSLGWI